MLIYVFYFTIVSMFFGGLFYSVDIVEWFRSRICVCPKCRRVRRVVQMHYFAEYVHCDGCGAHAVRYFKNVHIKNGRKVFCERDVWRDRYSAKTFVLAG